MLARLLVAATLLCAVLPGVQAATRPSNVTICDYYAAGSTGYTAQGEYNLVQDVIVAAATGGGSGSTAWPGLFYDPNTRGFFNASYTRPATGYPESFGGQNPNFSGNPTNQGWLVGHLVQYFGVALGCSLQSTSGGSTGPFPSYQGSGTMAQIHSDMVITQTVFNAFVNNVASAASSLGVTSSDVAIVGGVLNGFLRQQSVAGTAAANNICNDPSCTCAAGYSGSDCTPTPQSSTGTSAAGMAAPALFVSIFAVVAAFAMKQ